MKQLQFRFNAYIFAPSLFGVLVTMLCIGLCIQFGMWQYNKASTKQMLQARYNAAVDSEGIAFPAAITPADTHDIEALKYQKVRVTGYYLPEFTVLLDNQTERNRVGYHVITPLKIMGHDAIVLVNRGWIEAPPIHAQIPKVTSPKRLQNISGQIWVPSTHYFTLEKNLEHPADTVAGSMASGRTADVFAVVQNLDLAQYRKLTQLSVSPLVIKLDESVAEGGFERHWQVPVARISTHIGYAFQWFGFAFASLLIFLYMSIRNVDETHRK